MQSDSDCDEEFFAKPQLLLLDEPAAGMNPQETAELTEFIRRIRCRSVPVSCPQEQHQTIKVEVSRHNSSFRRSFIFIPSGQRALT